MFLKALDHLEESLVAILMAAATVIIFVAVVHRYASGVSFLYPFTSQFRLYWAQELCIIMFVWMAKFGAAYGVRTGIHVGVDVLINRLKARTRGKFIVFGLLSGALFTGTIAALGGHFVWENGAAYAFLTQFGLDTGDLYEGPVTADLEMPTWIVYSAIPLGSSLMCFRFLQVCWTFMHTGELPHHDHGHVEGLKEDYTDEQRANQDINWFAMDDGLHPKDIAHHEGREGGDPTLGGKNESTRPNTRGDWEGGDASAKSEEDRK